MANLRLAPGVAATRAKQRGRRGGRGRHAGHSWLEAVKVVLLLQRPRHRRGSSSPSLRQIALVVVSAGIVLVIVRVATHRGKRHTEAVPPPSGAQGDTDVPGNESTLTDRVQDEMFHRSDAVHPDA